MAQVIQDMDVLFNEALKSKVSQGQSEAVVKAPTTAVRWGSKVSDRTVVKNCPFKMAGDKLQNSLTIAMNCIKASTCTQVNKENPAESGYHWAVYKATVARHGVYKSAAAGNINFNEDLTGPCYDRITLIWNQIFRYPLLCLELEFTVLQLFGLVCYMFIPTVVFTVKRLKSYCIDSSRQ